MYIIHIIYVHKYIYIYIHIISIPRYPTTSVGGSGSQASLASHCAANAGCDTWVHLVILSDWRHQGLWFYPSPWFYIILYFLYDFIWFYMILYDFIGYDHEWLWWLWWVFFGYERHGFRLWMAMTYDFIGYEWRWINLKWSKSLGIHIKAAIGNGFIKLNNFLQLQHLKAHASGLSHPCKASNCFDCGCLAHFKPVIHQSSPFLYAPPMGTVNPQPPDTTRAVPELNTSRPWRAVYGWHMVLSLETKAQKYQTIWRTSSRLMMIDDHPFIFSIHHPY